MKTPPAVIELDFSTSSIPLGRMIHKTGVRHSLPVFCVFGERREPLVGPKAHKVYCTRLTKQYGLEDTSDLEARFCRTSLTLLVTGW